MLVDGIMVVMMDKGADNEIERCRESADGSSAMT